MSIELSRKPTEEEVEQICLAAEGAARHHLLSQVSLKRISDIDVTVEAVVDKPMSVSVEVAIELVTNYENLDLLVDQATSAAFTAAEVKARELNLCVSTNV